MKRLWKVVMLAGVLALMAAPALAFSGSDNPGTSNRQANQPSPPSKRALGVVCAQQNASKSNENDPDPGTPFSRCVRSLVKGLRSSKAKNADTPRGTAKVGCGRPDFDSGREFSRCVRVVAKTLRRASS